MEDNQLFWLLGSYFVRKKCKDNIKSSIGNYSLYLYDKSATAEYIRMQISSDGLFSEKKLIILSDLPSFQGSSAKSNKKWQEVFSNLPEECYLVLDNVSKNKRKLLNFVKKYGKVIEVEEYVRRNVVYTYVEKFLEEKNKNCSDEDIDKVIDAIGKDQKGYNLDLILMSFETICQYVGSKKNIKTEHVLRALPLSMSIIIWDLFDALDSKDFTKAELLFAKMIKIKGLDSSVEEFLNVSLWRYRMLLFVKEMSVHKKKTNDILRYCSELKKLEKNGTGIETTYSIKEDKPCFSDSLVRRTLLGQYGNSPVLSFYSRGKLMKAINVLEECLTKIRNSVNKIDKMLMIDNFFMFCCDLVDYNQLAKLRRLPDD